MPMISTQNMANSLPRRTLLNRISAIQRADLVSLWPMNERTGTVSQDIISAYNGAYSNMGGLGAVGVDNNLAATFNGSSSMNNFFSAGFASAWATSAQFTAVAHVKVASAGVWTDATIREIFYLRVDVNNFIVLRKTAVSNQLGAYYAAGGVSKSALFTVNAPTDYIAVGMTVDKANERLILWIDGKPVATTLTLGVWAGVITLAYIGTGGGVWSGTIGPVAMWKSALTAASIALASLCTGLVTFEGDSRTADNIYPAAAMAHSSLNAVKYGYANVALSGDTLANMIVDGPTQVDTLYRSTFTKNIAVLFGCINDAAAGASAATLYGRIQTWCLARRSAGFKVVVCTEIDAQSVPMNNVNWHSTLYLALNTLIRSGWASFADGLADLGNDARLQDATNLTYYTADLIHPNATGKAVIGEIVAPVIAGL